MTMKHLMVAVTFVIAVVVIVPLAQAQVKGKKVLIHVVANIKKDDGPPCVAFDIAYANVMVGNRVELLFDSEAAWNLKKSGADGKNEFDRYEVPADLKQLLASQFKDKDLQGVRDFGGFLELLAKKGATISVNGTWNVLTSVEKTLRGRTNLPSFVVPLTLKEMVGHMNEADHYYRY